METDQETDTVQESTDKDQEGKTRQSTLGPSKRLIRKRAISRQERRILLIDRRKWVTQLSYFRIGGNVKVYGAIPPILLVLKMQGRLLFDINGCGLDIPKNKDGVGGVSSSSYSAMLDGEESDNSDGNESDNSSNSDDDDDDDANGDMSGLAARRKILRQHENKERREKKRAALALAKEKQQSADNMHGFSITKHSFHAYKRFVPSHLFFLKLY